MHSRAFMGSVIKPWRAKGRGYLAGERACAGPLGLGVLDSAVLVGIKHSPCKKKKKVETPSGWSTHSSPTASFIPSLHFPESSRSLSFCSSAAPGGPARDAFAVPTNRTDVARSDKSLLTGSTGSLTRVNCDCQPGEALTLTRSPAALMRGIQRVDL